MNSIMPPAELRPQFFQSVVGPISHYVVAQQIPQLQKNIDGLFSLVWMEDQPAFGYLAVENYSDPAMVLREILQGAKQPLQKVILDQEDVSKFPLTVDQSIAAGRFLSEGKAKAMTLRGFSSNIHSEEAFTIEIISIINAIKLLGERTQGLEVNTIADFRNLIGKDGFLDSLRVLMSGASSFDILLSREDDPQTVFGKFNEENPHIATLVDGEIVMHQEVVDLAKESRRQGKSKRIVVEGKNFSHTSGCPAKVLSFRRSTEALEEYGLALTDEQIEILTSGNNPVVVPYKQNGLEGNIFVIERDCIEELSCVVYDFFHRLEVKLERMAMGSSNPIFRENLALIGLGPLAKEPPRRNLDDR